jgi:hypothetical protein
MWKDPIVEELHQIREQIALEHGNDLHAIVKYFQAKEQQTERRVVSFAPKRPAGWQPKANLGLAG